MKNIIFLAYDVCNPLSINWVHGFQAIGYNVTVLVANQPLPNEEELLKLGFYDCNLPKTPLFGLWEMESVKSRKAVLDSFSGSPDILFCWEGVCILKHTPIAHSYFPTAKVVYDICTHPSCSNVLAEWRYIWLYRQIATIVSGYIFYSQTQRQLFVKNVPSSSNKPFLIMIEPFLEKSFFSNDDKIDSDIPKLKRYDQNPHVIFTGNGKKLWNKSLSHDRKDALGPFLEKLSQREIHIFVDQRANTKGLSNLHLLPTRFNNLDIMNAKFSQYISQFDAHLVVYNEFNSTSRRKVASGLGTRFACAVASTCPIAVTSNSTFVKEYSPDAPFWFTFSNINDLVKSLHNKQLLESLSQNMKTVHRSYTFEFQSKRVVHFLGEF
ncbi:MAG: hypothetical protein HC939_17105 [Pleurocapsa sp. SU_5_0]|nr:hypothetical protein [Pleurocapsa sp. SU_5_0]